MFGEKKVTIGLEIGTRWITLVQMEEGRKAKRISRVVAKRLSAPSDEAISREIKELFAELKLRNPRLVTSIPRHLATVRFLKLPSTKESEIKEMVTFQVERQIPYSKEEVISGYQIVDTDLEGYSKVMLVIVHRDVVNRYLKILGDAGGFQPERLMLSSQAVSSAYLATRSAQAEPDAGPIALVDLGPEAIEVDVIHRGRLIFTRGISLGEISPFQEEGQAKVVEEVKRSFSVYQKEERELKVAKVILTGAREKVEALMSALHEELSMPVDTIHFLEEIPLIKRFSPPSESEVKGFSLATAIGLALDSPGVEIDLLPQQIRRQREFASRKKDLIKACALSLAILTVGSGIFLKKLHVRESYLKSLKASVRRTEPEARKVEAMMRRARVIRGQLDVRGFSIDILYELYRIIPPRTSLSIFILDEKKTVTLRGASRSMSDVFRLVGILEESPYFQNVDVKYASKRKVKEKELTDFQIICPLVSEGVREQ